MAAAFDATAGVIAALAAVSQACAATAAALYMEINGR